MKKITLYGMTELTEGSVGKEFNLTYKFKPLDKVYCAGNGYINFPVQGSYKLELELDDEQIVSLRKQLNG